jgi:hypothetical protein
MCMRAGSTSAGKGEDAKHAAVFGSLKSLGMCALPTVRWVKSIIRGG